MQEKFERYCELKEQEKKLKTEMEVLSEEIKKHFEGSNVKEDKTNKYQIFVTKKRTGWEYSASMNEKISELEQEKVDEQEQEIATPKYSTVLNIKELK